MKKILWFLLLVSSLLCSAQTVTPNIQLTLPAHGAPNWDVTVNANFSILDSNIGILQSPFKGAWSSATTYGKGQEVTQSGNLYVSIQANNFNNSPATSPTFWTLILPSALIGNPQGTANISTNFNSFNKVFQGSYFDGTNTQNNNWEFSVTTTPTSGSTVNNRLNWVPSFSGSCVGCTSDFAIGGGGALPVVGNYPTVPWWDFQAASSTGTINFKNVATISRNVQFADQDGTPTLAISTVPAAVSGNGTVGLTPVGPTGGVGGATTGTTGQTGGAGGAVAIAGGQGGNAPSGSTNGSGGAVTINGGIAGAGVGTAGAVGPVNLQTGTGNVGIGLTSPLAKLHVSGSAPIIRSDNTALGGVNWQMRNGITTSTTLDFIATGPNASGVSFLNLVDGGITTGALNELRIGTTTNIIQNSSRVFIFGGLNGANVDLMGDSVNGIDEAGFDAEGSDYATNFDFTRIDFFGNAAPGSLGTTLGFQNKNLGRLIFQSSIAGGAVGIIQNNTVQPLVYGINAGEVARMTQGGNFGVAVGAPTVAPLEVPLSIAIDPLPAPPNSAFGAQPTAGGSVTLGSHTWEVTYTNALGETPPSGASPVRSVTSGGTQTVPVNGIPIGPIGTTGRKLYRTVSGNTGSYLLVAAIADNTTTSFNDTVADGSLGAAAPSTNTTLVGKIFVQNASGTNVVGGTLTIQPGASTGNAVPSTLAFDGSSLGGGSGTTVETQIHRLVVNDVKSLITGSATTVLSIPLATLQMAGGEVNFYLEATDGTNQCTLAGVVAYSAENSASVFVTNTSVLGTAATACTAGKTLTATWAVTSANPALLQVTPTLTGITATRFSIIYEVHHMGQTNPTL